jgi:histidinol-phosphate aminotransferase
MSSPGYRDKSHRLEVEIPEHLRALKPYVAGKSAQVAKSETAFASQFVKLASNENPLGPSPLALEAVREALEVHHLYPDPASTRLTQSLAKRLGVEPEHVCCTAGSDAALGYLIEAFSRPGDELLSFEGTFIGWRVNVLKLGRRCKFAPLNSDYTHNVDQLIQAINPHRTKMVYVANPNNPTGDLISEPQLLQLIDGIPDRILIVVDEAYDLYAQDFEAYKSALHLKRPNVVITRTFSKSHGLAGFRVGYMVGPAHLIQVLRKVKLPFEPSVPGQLAAEAALQDWAFEAKTQDLNRRMLKKMLKKFSSLGLKWVTPHGNFVMLVFESALKAQVFAEECLVRGLIVRYLDAFGLPKGVRINSGTETETQFALRVIEQVVKSSR